MPGRRIIVRSAIIAVRHLPPAAGRYVRSYSFVTSDDVRCLITNYARTRKPVSIFRNQITC